MSTGQFRPLGLGDVLDGAFTLYRRHFATFVSTALLGLLPALVWVVVAFPLIMAEEGDAPDPVAAAVFGGISLLLFPLMFVGAVAMWGALTREASQAYLGGEVSVRDGLARAFRRFFPLAGAMLLWGLAIGVGFLMCLVPGVLLGVMFFGYVPALMVEEKGPIEALDRSRRLAQGAWGTIFLTLLVVWLITYVPGMALGTVFAVVVAALSATAAASEAALTGSMVAYYALSMLISALTMPFIALGIVLLYYDRRIRTEALDLELAAGGIAPSA